MLTLSLPVPPSPLQRAWAVCPAVPLSSPPSGLWPCASHVSPLPQLQEPKPSLQQLCGCEANTLQSFLGPLLDVLGRVALRLVRHEADQGLLRLVSAASFFADSEDDNGGEEEAAAPVKDELKEYLALPQIKYKSEQDAMVWWLQHQEQFPNLEVMARHVPRLPGNLGDGRAPLLQGGRGLLEAPQALGGQDAREGLLCSRNSCEPGP